jgi:hypothetical protein
MTKQIKFEGQIHSFPDNATDEEINEILGGASSKRPSDLLNNLAQEASGAYHMPLGRSLKNVGQGTVDLGEFVTNPAGPAMKYLATKDIPYLSKLAKNWPQYPESDLFGLGEKQPGDIAAPGAPALKGMQLSGKALSKIGSHALSKTSQLANKAGDLLPLTKKIASAPYKKQMQILEEKGLLQGYKPNPTDVLEGARLLTSKGMKIPHEAVNEAVAQTLEGNYKPWFNLQSSIRKEARRLSGMGGVHQTLGEKLHALAEKMHTEIGEAQAARGAPEAERLMHQGKARTAKYHKISPKSKIAGGITVAATAPKWISDMIKALAR